MKNIRFIIETSTTLPDEYLKANKITPMYMSISDKEGNMYVDERTDKQKAWVSTEIETKSTVFATSFINVGIMQEVVEKLLKECDCVVYVSLGKLYSGQYNSAMEVQKHFKGKFVVLHSNAISVNHEILTRWTIEYLKTAPIDVNYIEAQYNEMNKHITTIFTTPKYDGLIKTGRVPPIVVKALKMIKLIPLIASEEVNKRYKFFRKWSEAERQVFEGVDGRFKIAPRGTEIKELYITASILSKEYVEKLKDLASKYFHVSKDIIQVRTTPLVVFVSTLKDSFGITVYTKTLEKLKLN